MQALRNKKVVKIVSLTVAIVFLLGIGAVAFFQNKTATAGSSNSGAIGYVDYEKLMDSHPDSAKAKETLQQEYDNLKKEYEQKSQGMSEQEKQQLGTQYQQRMMQRQQDLGADIKTKVDAAIKDVAGTESISIVLDKSNVYFGGRDLTDDVIKKIGK